MDETKLFKALVDSIIADSPAEFGDKDIETAFLVRERPTPGQWIDVVPGGSCPAMALMYLSALPRTHKRFWRTSYEETNLSTGERERVKCLCVDVSINAKRLFTFLESRDFSGDAETLIGLYYAESITV